MVYGDSIETSENEAQPVNVKALIKERDEFRRKEQQDFEEWYLGVGGHPNNLQKDSNGDYVYVKQEWTAWLARASLPS